MWRARRLLSGFVALFATLNGLHFISGFLTINRGWLNKTIRFMLHFLFVFAATFFEESPQPIFSDSSLAIVGLGWLCDAIIDGEIRSLDRGAVSSEGVFTALLTGICFLGWQGVEIFLLQCSPLSFEQRGVECTGFLVSNLGETNLGDASRLMRSMLIWRGGFGHAGPSPRFDLLNQFELNSKRQMKYAFGVNTEKYLRSHFERGKYLNKHANSLSIKKNSQLKSSLTILSIIRCLL